MKKNLTRREFVRGNCAVILAAGIFPSIAPASALGLGGGTAPSNRITVGCIGNGPQGRGVMGGFLSQTDARVIALCDVSKKNLDAAVTQVTQKYQEKSCATHGDFRELLGRSDIDAVLIATPDHWHVPIAIAAARAGKDMYLEKPMGMTVAEDQLLREAVRSHRRVFQFGTQQRSSNEFRRACELVRNGRIGKLKQIDVWCSASRPGGSTSPAPVPEGLNYEMWLGPAPLAPYTFDKCFDNPAPGAWKTWWFNYDYALGFIAGWGVHPLDIAYWGHPEMMNGRMEIEGKGIIPTQGACNTAVAWNVDFTFANGVRMNYRGTPNGYETDTELNDMRRLRGKFGDIKDHGTAFQGTDGWVHVYRGGLHTQPETLAADDRGEIRLPQSSHHPRNFLDAVRNRGHSICPIDESVDADVLCHLSDISTRMNRKLIWDPIAERFVNDSEANARLALRPMRDPWRLVS